MDSLSPVPALGQPLFLMWSAVNRITKEGNLRGPEQRISAYDALRGSTIEAALQFFEENRPGTIEEGKLEDFVIFSGNPLKVEPSAIKNIQVLETIRERNTTYKQG